MLAFSDVEDLIKRQRNRLDLSKKNKRQEQSNNLYQFALPSLQFPLFHKGVDSWEAKLFISE